MTKSQARVTVVTKVNMRRAEKSPQLSHCPRCGGGFCEGLIIVTKKSTKARWYHEDCAKELNII